MAFTVDDFQDLIRLLGQHPEWRAELRRHVLSDELLELPALMRQLTERVDALVAAQAQTDARVDMLIAAQERTERRVASLENRVGELTGDVLEDRYARRAPAYFS